MKEGSTLREIEAKVSGQVGDTCICNGFIIIIIIIKTSHRRCLSVPWKQSKTSRKLVYSFKY